MAGAEEGGVMSLMSFDLLSIRIMGGGDMSDTLR